MFDEIPENLKESHPCPKCPDGSVSHAGNGIWECDTCDFSFEKDDKK